MSATAYVSDPGTHWTAGDPAWAALGQTGHAPVAEVAPAEDGEYAPV